MTVTLPSARVSLVDAGGRATREFYSFFMQVASGADAANRIDLTDISNRLTDVEAKLGDGTSGNIQGSASIETQGLLPGYVYITLQGDTDAPGNTQYYGSDGSGVRGWFNVSNALAHSGDITLDVGTDGVTTIGLADLADTGAGAALVKITRDAKGRIAGTSPAAKADIGLGNVDNTSDASKPVSTAQQAALDALLPPGYIDGLQMQWVSGTALTVTSGAAYIQGAGTVLRAPTAIAKTGLVLAASTWYHVYLYNNSGTPDVEVVTTAPAAPYNGTARSKAGDTTRRYVGSMRTDASGAFYPILHSHGRVAYTSGNSAGDFAILLGGTATASTPLSLAAVVPAATTMATLRLANNSLSTNFAVQMTVGADKFLSIAVSATSNGVPLTADCPIANQAMAYLCGGSSGNANIGLLGYIYER